MPELIPLILIALAMLGAFSTIMLLAARSLRKTLATARDDLASDLYRLQTRYTAKREDNIALSNENTALKAQLVERAKTIVDLESKLVAAELETKQSKAPAPAAKPAVKKSPAAPARKPTPPPAKAPAKRAAKVPVKAKAVAK